VDSITTYSVANEDSEPEETSSDTETPEEFPPSDTATH
jgi:hypothetical protein